MAENGAWLIVIADERRVKTEEGELQRCSSNDKIAARTKVKYRIQNDHLKVTSLSVVVHRQVDDIRSGWLVPGELLQFLEQPSLFLLHPPNILLENVNRSLLAVRQRES